MRMSTESAHVAETTDSGCVLVVEDDSLLRRVIVRLLKGWRFLVIEASDGGIALERFQADGDRLDVILLDIMLPVHNGVEVARSVRETSPNLPIVACSAAFNEDLIQDLRQLGVRYFLPKPFTAESLRATLLQAAGLKEPH